MLLGLLYALGHGLVVLVIGTVTIVAGKNLPTVSTLSSDASSG